MSSQRLSGCPSGVQGDFLSPPKILQNPSSCTRFERCFPQSSCRSHHPSQDHVQSLSRMLPVPHLGQSSGRFEAVAIPLVVAGDSTDVAVKAGAPLCSEKRENHAHRLKPSSGRPSFKLWSDPIGAKGDAGLAP
jgi:hypothetical protein